MNARTLGQVVAQGAIKAAVTAGLIGKLLGSAVEHGQPFSRIEDVYNRVMNHLSTRTTEPAAAKAMRSLGSAWSSGTWAARTHTPPLPVGDVFAALRDRLARSEIPAIQPRVSAGGWGKAADDATDTATAAGGLALAVPFSSAAGRASERATPSFLELGRHVWSGPEAQSLAQAAGLAPGQVGQLAKFMREEPLHAKAALMGMTNFPGFTPEVSKAIRKVTFNSPVSSHMGDTMVKILGQATDGQQLFQHTIAGNPYSSAGFDVGPDFHLPESRWGNTGTVQSVTPHFGNGPSNKIYRHSPQELASETSDLATVRLRPKSPVTPEDVARATPEINQIYGPKTIYNTAERYRATHREALGEEGAGWLQKFTDWMRANKGRKKMVEGIADRVGLGDMLKRTVLPYMRQGTGETCSTAAAKALNAVKPGIFSPEAAAHATPQDILRQTGKTLDVAGMHLHDRFARPTWLAASEALSHAPTALRAGVAVTAGTLGTLAAGHLLQQHGPQMVNAVGNAIAPQLTSDLATIKALKG